MSGDNVHLENSPLAEAVFELRWHLVTDQAGNKTDPGFKILLGRLFERIQDRYPVSQELPAAEVPQDLLPHVVRHRFRAAVDAWPVLQIGPGIMSVNLAGDYRWTVFRDLIAQALVDLSEAYPMKIKPLRAMGADLRYINTIPLDGASDLVEFMGDRLHISISIEAEADRSIPAPSNASLSLTYKYPEMPGALRINLARARDEDVLILDLTAACRRQDATEEVVDYAAWIEGAHERIHEWFFSLCRGQLLESFD